MPISVHSIRITLHPALSQWLGFALMVLALTLSITVIPIISSTAYAHNSREPSITEIIEQMKARLPALIQSQAFTLTTETLLTHFDDEEKTVLATRYLQFSVNQPVTVHSRWREIAAY